MKKLSKIFICLVLFLSFSLTVFAEKSVIDDLPTKNKEEEETDTDKGLSVESQEQLENAKQATEDYCHDDKTVKGCIYNENDELYTDFTGVDTVTINYGQVSGDIYYVTFKNVPLTRGYQAFNGDGEGVFVGCYKTVYNNIDENGHDISGYPKALPAQTPVFIFKFVYLGGKSCKAQRYYVVPVKGTKTAYGYDTYYDGKQALTLDPDGNGETFATFNKWVATKDGACPNIFGYTSNANFLTSSENIYSFSESDEDYKNRVTYSFLTNEKYVSRPGCTVSDKEGEEEAQKLVDALTDEISKKACPDKIEGLKEYSENLEDWYANLRNDNKYRDLWSKALGSKVTEEKVKTQIYEAVKKKMQSCQNSICNLTVKEISKIKSKRGSTCKNGCELTVIASQSDSESAVCYACGNSSGVTYKWIDPNEVGSNCTVKKNKTQNQCIGTSKDEECRSCLSEAYDAAGLSVDKKKCLATSELNLEITLRNFKLFNESAAKNDTKKEQDENSKLREKLFNGQFDPVELFFNEPLTCAEVLDGVLLKIVKSGITIIQIVAAIIAIVKGMLIIVPAVTARDGSALQSGSKQLIIIGVLLALIIAFRPLVRLIGIIFDYDVSCVL